MSTSGMVSGVETEFLVLEFRNKLVVCLLTLLLFSVSNGYRNLVPGAGMAMLSDGLVVVRKCTTSWKMYRNLGMPRFGPE